MKIIIFVLTFFSSFIAVSQTFEVVSILNSGTDASRINLVILADGYTRAEQDKFVLDAKAFTTAFFSQSPYKEYQNYFNVYAIKVISNQSGASHPGTATDVNEPGTHPRLVVDNYFGSTFDSFNIHRLLVPTKNSNIVNVLNANFPEYDQVLILVNTPFYGGSGGSYATTSLDVSSNQIAIHEIGHSFSNLADEYWAGDAFAIEKLNLTQTASPLLTKWKNWSGLNGVSAYVHGTTGVSANWYRPHQNCMMRYLGSPFCSVCKEATVERIHSLTSPLLRYSPNNSSNLNGNASSTINFSLDLIKTLPTNTIKVEWILNNTTVTGNDTRKYILDTSKLTKTVNSLQANIRDLSPLLKVDNHQTIHFKSVLWTINKSVSGRVSVIASKANLTMYPNPAVNELNIDLSTTDYGSYTMEIYNMNGQKVLTQNALTINQKAKIDTSTLASGTYILNLNLDNGLVFKSQFIKE
jgi:hypothetical protein